MWRKEFWLNYTSPGNVVRVIVFLAVLAPRLLLPPQIPPGGRMLLIPPRVIGPINRGAVAIGRAALEPEIAGLVLPDAHSLTVELLAAMEAPLRVLQVWPVAIMVAEQVELFVVGKDDVVGHRITSFSGLDDEKASPPGRSALYRRPRPSAMGRFGLHRRPF